MKVMISTLEQHTSLKTAASDEERGAITAAPAASWREMMRRFWPYARPYRRWLLPTLLRTVGHAVRTGEAIHARGLLDTARTS